MKAREIAEIALQIADHYGTRISHTRRYHLAEAIETAIDDAIAADRRRRAYELGAVLAESRIEFPEENASGTGTLPGREKEGGK